MVPLSLNFSELLDTLKREIIRRIDNLKVNEESFDFGWLVYALSLNTHKNDVLFRNYMRMFEGWVMSESSGKQDRELAPLSVCSFLSSNSEVKQKAIDKAKRILDENLEKMETYESKINTLKDPFQVFCLSLGLKENLDDEEKKKIADIVRKHSNGKALRKALFVASLIELGYHHADVIEKIDGDQTELEDIVSVLWLYERYRDTLKRDVLKAWQRFDSIIPSINIERADEEPAISNTSLALLYEAIVNEFKKPDPNMLFDLYPLHPEIKKVACEHFKNGKYVSAVFETTKKLNEFIQGITGIRDKSEVKLVRTSILGEDAKNKQPDFNKALIIFNDFLNELSGEDEQEGLGLIAEGIFTAFRNPKGHKPEDHSLVQIEPYEALAQLITIDYIWKKIEKAKIKREAKGDA